jgi:D-glycerate 3-kinase
VGIAGAWAAADSAAIDTIAAACSSGPIAVGLCGAQGSGKSTMATRLAAGLRANGLVAAVLSLDDFYLSGAARADLARRVHPLLATRGVPGTHDIARLTSTVCNVLGQRAVQVPRFDKLRDEPQPLPDWPMLKPPCDVVILEGWCIGARPQDESALAAPVNALEREADPDGVWRRWVNAQLAGAYADLFARLRVQIFLRAPGFEVVTRWRGEQEAGLVRAAGGRGMDDAALARFVAYYERLTRAMIADAAADLVIDLDANRIPIAITRR